MSRARVNIPDVLQSYSRKLLFDFREGAKTSAIPFDRGLPREKAIRDFLSARLPGRYGVGEGLVIDAEGGQSAQCDVVIFDRERMPVLSTETAMTIWPFESVYAVAQVKSVLTEREMTAAVENLAAFKALRRADHDITEAGSGFVSRSLDKLNPPVSLLVAHELDADLTPQRMAEIASTQPTEKQIDAICDLSGWVYFRGSKVDGATVLDLVGGRALIKHDFGDGALAAFLFMLIDVLNSITLGQPDLLRYMSYLGKK